MASFGASFPAAGLPSFGALLESFFASPAGLPSLGALFASFLAPSTGLAPVAAGVGAPGVPGVPGVAPGLGFLL